MLLFYTTEDIRIRLRDLDQRIELRAHPRAPSLSSTRVYCTTRRISLLIDRWIDEHGRNGVLHKLTAERAALAFNLPPYLGGAIPGQRTLPPLTAMLAESRRAGRTGKYSLGAFNGLGGGIGDTITGLCALRCARDHVIAAGGPDFTTDLIVDPDAALRIEPIVRSDPLVRRVMTTPQPISTLQKYDGVWDFDSLLFDPRFDDTPLVDYFLDRMGVAPASVERKAPPPESTGAPRCSWPQAERYMRRSSRGSSETDMGPFTPSGSAIRVQCSAPSVEVYSAPSPGCPTRPSLLRAITR